MAEAPCPRGRGRLADPQGQGTPCRVPSQPLSTILLDVSPRLDGQTTSKYNGTKSGASVSKIASQRFKNRVDPTSVLREKPRKPKDACSKAQDDASQPSPGSSPTGELGHGARPWPRPPVLEVGGSASRPSGAGDPLQGPQSAPFDDTS